MSTGRLNVDRANSNHSLLPEVLPYPSMISVYRFEQMLTLMKSTHYIRFKDIVHTMWEKASYKQGSLYRNTTFIVKYPEDTTIEDKRYIIMHYKRNGFGVVNYADWSQFGLSW